MYKHSCTTGYVVLLYSNNSTLQFDCRDGAQPMEKEEQTTQTTEVEVASTTGP